MVNKRTILLKIYLTPEENQDLQARADAAQLSRSHYGRAALFSLPELSSSGQLQHSELYPWQARDDALILQLGQYYSLLSILQSDIAAGLKAIGLDCHLDDNPHRHPHRLTQGPSHHTSMPEQLQRLQSEIAVIQAVIQELAEHLHRQTAP